MAFVVSGTVGSFPHHQAAPPYTQRAGGDIDRSVGLSYMGVAILEVRDTSDL